MILIQPRYACRDQWKALAEQEELFYEALELSMPGMLGPDSGDPKCRDWYRDCGRTRTLHGAFMDVNPASGDPDFRALSRRRCRDSCELALVLNIKNVVFHSSAFPFLRGTYLENWAGVCADFYTELVETYGLVICLENSMDLNPEPLFALLRGTSDPRVQVCLDIGHAHYAQAPLKQWFDELGAHIGYLHLSDNNGQYDDHLPLGMGTVDWALAQDLWRQLGRSVPMTLEVGGISGAAQSLAFLKQHGYFGIGGSGI